MGGFLELGEGIDQFFGDAEDFFLRDGKRGVGLRGGVADFGDGFVGVFEG